MQQSFANDTVFRQLVQDLRAPFCSSRTVLLLATLAGLAGLVGPFGTYDAFPAGLRLLYWAAIIAGTAGIGHAATSALERALRGRGAPLFLELTVIAFLAAVPVCLVVALVTLAFGFNPLPGHLLELYLQCAAVLAGIALLFHLTAPPPLAAGAAAREARTATPALLRRLPAHKRGRLVQIRAQDHYVEVVTENGRALIAMRFRDAIAETAPETGLQCHRSHWVARHAVARRGRQDSRSGLWLTCGSFVPVGRTFSTAVKQALDTPNPGDQHSSRSTA